MLNNDFMTEPNSDQLTKTEALGDLLNGLARVINANKHFTIPKGEEWKRGAEAFALKILYHASSVQKLKSDDIFSAGGIKFKGYDVQAVNILARVILETYYVFTCLFSANIDSAEREFRSFIWELEGIKTRKGVPAVTSLACNKAKEDDARLMVICAALEKNTNFSALSVKKQESLKKKELKEISFSKVFFCCPRVQADAEMNISLYRCFRNLFNSHVHADAHSISQITQDSDKQIKLSGFAIAGCLIGLSFFIKKYSELFPPSKQVLVQDRKLSEILVIWTTIGRKNIQEILRA